MSALDRLAGMLRGSVTSGEKPIPVEQSIDDIIAQLQRHARAGTHATVAHDLQQEAVGRFWEARRFDSLRDARLVSFGMCVPNRPSGPCIMEDRQRFQAVLDGQGGVDQWLNEPRWYRRCYQGLVRSYFTYDASSERASSVGRQNWGDLRDYLSARTSHIADSKTNPDWVGAVLGNRQLFSKEPCAPYAAAVLNGNSSDFDQLCEKLGVIKASWFLRELILAQVKEATTLSHERFSALIPKLVELLEGNGVLRDRGLVLMLDKYASAAQPAIHEPLRNAAVDWWGNPWLPSNEMRWGGVIPAAREMVSEWLTREFIEAFFTKLAEDGVGDKRRANFWLRYAKSMRGVHFALGAKALYSKDPDFVVLRKKMKGLFTELRTGDRANNAFVMTMGDLVAVEFGGMGNAFYGYDTRRDLPFNLSSPLLTTKNAPNSLKHDERMLWMRHQDGILGWNRWEDGFEATLKEQFNIKPDAMKRRSAAAVAPAKQAHRQEEALPSFTVGALRAFAEQRTLVLDDLREKNGNLWVRTDDSDVHINKVLLHWGFVHRAGKGWWR